MCSFPFLFFGSKRPRFESFFRGFGGGEARPQQGRLHHEVASKHRACQTSNTEHNTRNRKRFSVMLGSDR